MGMDIDLELTELIHQYHIDECCPLFYKSHRAEKIAKVIYESLGDVVLVGTKQTDIKWFQRIVCRKNVPALLLIEEDFDEQIRKYEDYRGVFLNVSYYGRNEVLVRLLESGFQAVSLYDEFEKEGIIFTDNFYDIYGEEYNKRWSKDKKWSKKKTRDFLTFDINKIFFYHRRRFELESDPDNKKVMLKKLIFDCAYARDFLVLKKYIDIFQEQFAGEEGECYLLFYQEVEKLLLRIKSALANRSQKDCIMIWLDALEYGDDESMPFLCGLNDNSLVFQNMYTVTAYTSHTLKTIFAKSRSVEEEAYKLAQIGRGNSMFLTALEQRDYKFQYYGIDDVAVRFEDEYMTGHFYSFYCNFTQMYWDIISDILRHNTKKSFFCVLHELTQTHVPFVSMGLTGEKYIPFYDMSMPGYQPTGELRDGNILESREYVDRQLEFYGRLLPEKMLKIYMSDHGHTFFGRYHCILKIQQKSLKPQTCDDLISWYDADKLILGLIDGKPLDKLEIRNDYVIIQDTEYYGRDFIAENLNNRKISRMILERYGFQGVVTKEDLFIRYNVGEELYQKKFNDECMVTDGRLNYLREITSKKKVDLSKEEKFKYARLVQRVMERCRARTAERQEEKNSIVKNVFVETSKEKVMALRGGGLPSLRLLMLLDENSRKKVRYIIDEEKECYAGKMGIRVVSMEEAGDCRIDKVIIVSYDYHREWKEECLNSLKTEVVDIYDILDRHGIECQEDFYNLEYAEEDFEGIEV